MADSSWLFQEGPLSLDDLTPGSTIYSPQVFSPPLFSPLAHPHQTPANTDSEQNRAVVEGLAQYVKKREMGKPINRFLVDHVRVRSGLLLDTQEIRNLLTKWKDMSPGEWIDGMHRVEAVQQLVHECEDLRQKYNNSMKPQRDPLPVKLGRLSLSLDVRGSHSDVINSCGVCKEDEFDDDIIAPLDGDIIHAKVSLNMPRHCESGLGSSPDTRSMLEVILTNTAETCCFTSKTRIYHKGKLFIEKCETLFGVAHAGSTVIKDPFHNKFWAAIVNYHLNGVSEFSAREFSITQEYYSESHVKICTVVFEFEVGGSASSLVYRVTRKPIKRRRSVSQEMGRRPPPLRSFSTNCLPSKQPSKKWVANNDLRINFYQPGG